MNPLLKLTIIIPTYNRPAYLKRLLRYYSDNNIRVPIIIADGSSVKAAAMNGATVLSLPELNIDYQHKQGRITERLLEVVNQVASPYCVLCADDDFITPVGLSAAADFLDNNSDYAVAHGRYISFKFDIENGRSFCWWRTAYPKSESIAQCHPAFRLSQHLSEYNVPTFYAVHRIELLKMIFAEAVQHTDENFVELLGSSLALVHGKMKCLRVLYAARDEGVMSIGDHFSLRDAFRQGTYSQQYERFRECLADHLTEQSQLSSLSAGQIVDIAMAAYLKKYYSQNRFRSLIGAVTTKTGLLMNRMQLPAWLDKAIRMPYKILARGGE